MAMRIGSGWNQATLPMRAVSMVSELSLAAAHSNGSGGNFTHWSSELRYDGRIRLDSKWRSNPWDPGDDDVQYKNLDLELQHNRLSWRQSSIEASVQWRSDLTSRVPELSSWEADLRSRV